MVEHLLPVVFAVALWWGSTGLILRLDWLPRATFRWTMLGATALLAAGVAGLAWSAQERSLAAVYLGLVSAILAWGWIEIAFLTGFVTGPRRVACPPEARGWVRLRAAIAVILWHELAIVAVGVVVALITLDAPNPYGGVAFLALAAMRLSAKLNLFLGVRNFGEAMLPEHLRYLETYFARRRMNALFPFSVLGGTAACVGLIATAAAPGSDVVTATGHTLLASLIALGVLEHAFMVLPVPPEALYRRILPARPVAFPDDLHVPSRGVVPRAAVSKPHGSRP
ncbi:putative photosynthetic complex assembly protein PuhE [Neoroseomonas oryzicola]|uniref:DUF3623 domain-containing protein n=1 Tax=Neoroseomonas oryzicola TaxID=535904 RepID=A0A9X9WBA1_9PROT|nr:putative photosynthetic complex assembly protein PuhE [Neoroseomonas oryzicola]MBR0657611.1 DUF3623 domain-containing protein [Neoroseomonas oryzicola]NKE18867.1 DUF3623 domain-containing protein [Neoroseomonas oryzicola]